MRFRSLRFTIWKGGFRRLGVKKRSTPSQIHVASHATSKIEFAEPIILVAHDRNESILWRLSLPYSRIIGFSSIIAMARVMCYLLLRCLVAMPLGGANDDAELRAVPHPFTAGSGDVAEGDDTQTPRQAEQQTPQRAAQHMPPHAGSPVVSTGGVPNVMAVGGANADVIASGTHTAVSAKYTPDVGANSSPVGMADAADPSVSSEVSPSSDVDPQKPRSRSPIPSRVRSRSRTHRRDCGAQHRRLASASAAFASAALEIAGPPNESPNDIQAGVPRIPYEQRPRYPPSLQNPLGAPPRPPAFWCYSREVQVHLQHQVITINVHFYREAVVDDGRPDGVVVVELADTSTPPSSSSAAFPHTGPAASNPPFRGRNVSYLVSDSDLDVGGGGGSSGAQRGTEDRRPNDDDTDEALD